MRGFGYVLITGGFLAGAFFAVRQVEGLPVAPFLAALAAGIAGVVIVRRAIRGAARHEDRLTADFATLGGSLERLVAAAETLEREQDAVGVYDLRHRIDGDLVGDLAAFAAARESIAVSYGLKAYAEVMSHFAAGERHLNRVWSASTDGYVDEAREYLARGREQLADALAAFRRLSGGAPEATPPPARTVEPLA
jgi:hypothetical protein